MDIQMSKNHNKKVGKIRLFYFLILKVELILEQIHIPLH